MRFLVVLASLLLVQAAFAQTEAVQGDADPPREVRALAEAYLWESGTLQHLNAEIRALQIEMHIGTADIDAAVAGPLRYRIDENLKPARIHDGIVDFLVEYAAHDSLRLTLDALREPFLARVIALELEQARTLQADTDSTVWLIFQETWAQLASKDRARRAALMRRLDEVAQTSVWSVSLQKLTSDAFIEGMAAGLGEGAEEFLAHMAAQRYYDAEALRDEVATSIREGYAFTYQPLSDDEMEAFIAVLETDLMQWNLAARRAAVGWAYREAMYDLGQYLGEMVADEWGSEEPEGGVAGTSDI